MITQETGSTSFEIHQAQIRSNRAQLKTANSVAEQFARKESRIAELEAQVRDLQQRLAT